MLTLLPWQQADWMQFAAQYERLPGALLLTGPQGIGKGQFAQRVAQALLCEAPQVHHAPCGVCPACQWLVAESHPDYRQLTPDRADEDEGKGPRKLAQIKIERVREVIAFAQLSAHRAGRRVIVISPVEALNSAAANALLKLLEEPPLGVYFILVTQNSARVLPTLLSRCRQFPMTQPGPQVALAWLTEQGVARAETELAFAGGAPLALLEMAQVALRDRLVSVLAHPSVDACLAVAAELDSAKIALEQPLTWLLKWVYDLAQCALVHTIRYFPEQRTTLEALAPRVNIALLMSFQQQVLDLVPFGQHTLSVKLQIEKFLLEYQALFSRAAR